MTLHLSGDNTATMYFIQICVFHNMGSPVLKLTRIRLRLQMKENLTKEKEQ